MTVEGSFVLKGGHEPRGETEVSPTVRESYVGGRVHRLDCWSEVLERVNSRRGPSWEEVGSRRTGLH